MKIPTRLFSDPFNTQRCLQGHGALPSLAASRTPVGWRSYLALLMMGICLTCAFAAQSAQAANLSATWSVFPWSGGYTANLVVKNNGSTAINNWSAKFKTPQKETAVWNATISGPIANVYTVKPASWASTLAAKGGTATIGFTFNGTPPLTPINFTINGQAVTLNTGGVPTPTPTPSPSPTATPNPTATPSPTATPVPTPTATPSPSPSTTPIPSPTPTPTPGSVVTSGQINFHYYYGTSPTAAEDSMTLTGDNYTDLIMANMIAGVMYGHLIQEFTPGMQFNQDYLYGSIFGQLLQENLATEYYTKSSPLIDPSSDQQAVMGTGQGGPYQINNYAADMVAGTYQPQGFSLINFVALQKNIGFTISNAATQYSKPTPASFNNKYYGPMLTAYFHFNDYKALQYIGGSSLTNAWTPSGASWTPAWQPSFYTALSSFQGLPGNQLDILLNVAYNAGYYAQLFVDKTAASANSSTATVASFNSFTNAWAGDSYHQYPYQVRGYLDQLYDIPTPNSTDLNTLVTPNNHVAFNLAALSGVFSTVFQTLAYVDGSGNYSFISDAQASAAFASAMRDQGLSTANTLDLSNASDRAKIFRILNTAITNLESTLNTSFSQTTLNQL